MKIIKLLKALENKLFVKSIFIVVLMILGSILEMIGISLIVPFLKILSNIDISEQYVIIFDMFIDFKNSEKEEILFKICILIGLVFSIKILFLIYINFIQLKFIQRFHQILGKILISIYLARPLKYFLTKNSSFFLRNLSTELTLMSSSIINFGLIILESLILFFIFGFLLFYSPKITIFLIFIFSTFMIIYIKITKKKIVNWGNERHASEESKIKILKEALTFVREIRLYNLEKNFISTFEKSNKKFSQSMLNHSFIQLIVKYNLELLFVLLLLIFVNLTKITENFSEVVPTIGLYVGSAFRILPSLNRIINSYQQIKYIDPVMNNFLNDILESKSNLLINKSLKLNFENKINFNNVSFSHTNSKPLFENLNIEITKGDFVGVVGDSGIGKSTFLDLISGFIKVSKGEIKVDNKHNIFDNLNNWQNNVGYLPQNNIILDDSLINNILLYNENEADMARLNEVIEISGLIEIVKNLPDGLNTTLGENGNRLSGGQKQRLGIARTLYSDKSILLFDEATNALDENTNFQIIKKLKKYCKEKHKTIIFVSHNSSIEKNVDKIINLNKKVS